MSPRSGRAKPKRSRIRTIRVESLQEYLSRVRELVNDWEKEWDAGNEWLCWFRGEGNVASSTALIPRLYRPQGRINPLLHLEQELRLEFKRCGAQLATGIRPNTHWEWYFTMQHYGAPTRLLDWTDSALVALYFATEKRGMPDDKYSGADAVVYALDPWWLNEFAFKNYRKSDRSEGVALPDWGEAQKYLHKDEFKSESSVRSTLPLAIDPTHLFGRVAAQRSRFVIFGRDRQTLKTLALKKDARIVAIRIEESQIPTIKKDLRVAGLSHSTIYPDLEGLAVELRYWFDQETLVK